jgi:hypothetical protein
VTDPTGPVPPLRLASSTDGIERELRRSAFALVEHYLATHRLIAGQLRLDPVELLIYAAATTGNVQRAVRSDALPGRLRGREAMPPEMIVPISRRALARVTGLPTESVRRHVQRLVDRGLLVSTPRGVYALNRLADDGVKAAILALVESQLACTERLVALRAVVAAK